MTVDISSKILDMLEGYMEPTPGGEYVEANFLEPIRLGNLGEARILADWLEDNGYSDKAQQVLELLTAAHFRQCFKESAAEYSRVGANCVGTSRLEFVRRCIGLEICRLFPDFLQSRTINAINEFTRKKLREDGVIRRAFRPQPVPPIGNTELDALLANGYVVIPDNPSPAE